MSGWTKKCSLKDFQPEITKEIRRYMSENESIIVCYETIIRMDRDHTTYSQVLTEDQLVQHTKLPRQEWTLHAPLIQVTDIDLSGGMSDWRVNVNGKEHSMQVFFNKKEQAQEFREILLQAVKQTKSKSVSASAEYLSRIEVLELIEKLRQSKERGGITEQEFQQKKSELLRRI